MFAGKFDQLANIVRLVPLIKSCERNVIPFAIRFSRRKTAPANCLNVVLVRVRDLATSRSNIISRITRERGNSLERLMVRHYQAGVATSNRGVFQTQRLHFHSTTAENAFIAILHPLAKTPAVRRLLPWVEFNFSLDSSTLSSSRESRRRYMETKHVELKISRARDKLHDFSRLHRKLRFR